MAPDRNARLAHSMRSSSYVFCNAALVALKHRSLLIRFWISGGASMAAPKVQQGALRSVVTDHLTPEGTSHDVTCMPPTGVEQIRSEVTVFAL